VPAPQYVHPQFRYRSPKQRFQRGLWLALACLGVAGIGAAMMVPLGPSKSDAAMAPADQVSRAETIPAVSPAGYAAVDPQPASEHGAQAIAGKSSCLGQSRDGSCVSFQLPKVRMVRLPRVASVGQQGNSAKSGVAANSRATELDKGIAETKKAQRSAHRQNQRRNQPSHSTPSRGDVRVADWAARGYASTWRSDQGRQGFARNFW
jgi:hypothetical protein